MSQLSELAPYLPPQWVLLALCVAVVEALKDLFAKRTGTTLSARGTALAINLYALPLALGLALREPLPSVDYRFFVTLTADTALHFCAVGLYMYGISVSDLSVTLPMISFTPLFLLFTAPLMLGIEPSPRGAIGVLLIVAGAYLLNIGDRSRGLLGPFRALLEDRGARAMLLVAFLWSITANIDPIGIGYSNRPWWLVSLILSLIIAFWIASPRADRVAVLRSREGAIAGLCNGASLVLYLVAITAGPLPYVLALKRLSILVGMLLGAILLGELRFRERLLGAAVMIGGVVVISTA